MPSANVSREVQALRGVAPDARTRARNFPPRIRTPIARRDAPRECPAPKMFRGEAREPRRTIAAFAADAHDRA